MDLAPSHRPKLPAILLPLVLSATAPLLYVLVWGAARASFIHTFTLFPSFCTESLHTSDSFRPSSFLSNSLHFNFTLIMPVAPYARPMPLLPLSSPIKGALRHSRQRSVSASSHSSTSASRPFAAFPALSTMTETLQEQNASDILWKVFVAFEQDCRESP